MVLRKNPPPGINVPQRARKYSDPRSPVSRSSASPRSATQHARKDSWELDTDSIYSPDLHTSPAFDLMPLEQAQKSPVASQGAWEDELVERPAGMAHVAPPGAAVGDQAFGGSNGINYQHTGMSAQSGDDSQRQGITGDSALGTSPQRFRSNNPFLRNRTESPNPWEGGIQQGQVQPHLGQGSSVSSLHPDASERNSQTSGIIPMTARLSIFEGPQDTWNQSSQQPVAQTDAAVSPESALRAPSENRNLSSPGGSNVSNLYLLSQTGEESQNNHWQEPVLTGASNSTGVSNTTASSQPVSDQLIDLENTPTNAEANPWSAEQSTAPRSDQNQASDQPTSTPEPLPPMSEAELRMFQEKQAETYAIRHVNWTDRTGQLRESPVLVQSQNGPCPLLALVNGLIMRSDKNAPPPIVRALQIREHISLGLLIQALFDELVTYSNEELPDIEALSRFLTMLHTGMNVNPRLTLELPTALGSFFETKDLLLYDSFKVPLIHGWIAAPTSNANTSMARVAQYYEDIQLLQFRKEELEDRVFRNGATLSPDEERLMGDIQTITHFVNIENPTQLTGFGLAHLSKMLSPGSVSILFRNDHFSTLYKHPQSGQLFTLITDAGYADHAEVVWESLVDVSGSDAEFYAGDFRPVGHGPSGSTPAGPSHLVGQRTSSRTNAAAATNAASSQNNTEQEDADYAYALSLQYQEEEREQQQQQQQRQRQPQAQPPRNRSSSNRLPNPNTTSRNSAPAHRYSQSATSGSSLSQRNPSVTFSSINLSNRSNSNVNVNTTNNNNNNNSSNQNLDGIPQDGPSEDGANDDLADDAPPPSYEQVARNKAAEVRNQRQQQSPPPVRASYSSSPGVMRAESAARRNQYPGSSSQYPGAGIGPAGATGRRQPLQTVPDRGARGSPRDKDCIVM